MNKLGRRLRHGESPTDKDLELLAQYQASLVPLLTDTLNTVEAAFKVAVPDQEFEAITREKQLRSIVAKLQRQQTSMTSIQDIVGARLTVQRALHQESLVQQLPITSGWRIIDRRAKPSYGYRAIHLIRTEDGRTVEIQIRTQLQHQWAELSERWDRIVPGVKYGEGPANIRETLKRFSEVIADLESLELKSHREALAHEQRMRDMHTKMNDILMEAIQRVPGR